MAAVKKNIEDTQRGYQTITELFNLAEELLDTTPVDDEMAASLHLSAVEPFVGHIAEATDLLAEEYLNVVKSPAAAPKTSRQRVEGALRKIYLAFEDYNQRLQFMSRASASEIRQKTDKFLAKIRKQVEQILLAFLEIMALSLQVIMSKQDLEQLKLREARVALAMHHAATKPVEM